MPQKIYLGLGSNLGDRRAALDAAVAALAPQVRELRRSPIYETVPWGFADQPDFLNQVLEAETELEPTELLKLLKTTEKELGRLPRTRNGPREIDIDILLYDDLTLEAPGLRLPHPNLQQRAFVLVPLADLAPDLAIPGRNATVKDLLAPLDLSVVKPYKEE